METISRHAVKYRTEKYFKNKLIKNFTHFDLGKKSEFKDDHAFSLLHQELPQILVLCFS